MNFINLAYLEGLEKVRMSIRQSQDFLEKAEQPLCTDWSLLPFIHETLIPVLAGANKGDRIRAELLCMLYIFAPNKLMRRTHQHEKIYDAIAGTMDIPDSNLRKYKKDILHFYRYYADFRELTDKCIFAARNLIDCKSQ